MEILINAARMLNSLGVGLLWLLVGGGDMGSMKRNGDD